MDLQIQFWASETSINCIDCLQSLGYALQF